MKLEEKYIYCTSTLMPIEVKSLNYLTDCIKFKDRITNQKIRPESVKKIIELPKDIFNINVSKNFMNNIIIDENFNAYIMTNDKDEIRYVKYYNKKYTSRTMHRTKDKGTLEFFKLESADSDNYFVKLSQVVASNINSKITKLSLILLR